MLSQQIAVANDFSPTGPFKVKGSWLLVEFFHKRKVPRNQVQIASPSCLEWHFDSEAQSSQEEGGPRSMGTHSCTGEARLSAEFQGPLNSMQNIIKAVAMAIMIIHLYGTIGAPGSVHRIQHREGFY